MNISFPIAVHPKKAPHNLIIFIFCIICRKIVHVNSASFFNVLQYSSNVFSMHSSVNPSQAAFLNSKESVYLFIYKCKAPTILVTFECFYGNTGIVVRWQKVSSPYARMLCRSYK